MCFISKKRKMLFTLAIVLCIAFTLASCEGKENLTADCQNGKFIGQEETGVKSFKGIPYAKAPVGDLRWKAPEMPDDSDSVIKADNYGNSAIQTEWFSEEASYNEQSENCLTLNVWTTDLKPRKAKPVMVFFHGGAYGWGGTSDPLYDGKNFIKEHDDVILVSANYRVGMMGFIDFSKVQGGEEFADSPNLGILDQIAALEWVQKNIEQFGGDPKNVTIFGESAGGGSTSILLAVDKAKGLFQKAISQSGSVALTSSKEDCQALTERILSITGAKDMKDLMALSEADLKKVNETKDEAGNTINDKNNMPQRDGKLIPVDPYKAIADGAGKDVPLLIGTNENEWNYWIGEMAVGSPDENYKAFVGWMNERFNKDKGSMTVVDKAVVDRFIQLQSDKKDIWKTTEFYNDIAFRVPACIEAANHSNAGGTSYMYYWAYPSSVERYGACHAVELAYIFNNLDETTEFTGENPNMELAPKVQEAWVNFAKTGNPSISEIEWPSYNSETRETMFIGADWKVVKDPLAQQRKLIEQLIKYDIK